MCSARSSGMDGVRAQRSSPTPTLSTGRTTVDTITICPFFFDPSHSIGELIRTWLHEAGHVVGIDDPPPGQEYEHPPNCETQRGDDPVCPQPYDPKNACPGGDIHNVDNWAYFLDH